MSTHAKAASAGPTERSNGKRRFGGLLAILALALCALGSSAPAALAAAPTVTVDPASEVGFTTAKASGEVVAEGQATSYRFEFVSDQQFDENEAHSQPAFAGAGQVGGSVEPAETANPEPLLENLAPGTEYHLRLVAENADGIDVDVAPNFTTQTATAPVVAIKPPANVSYNKALMAGTIDPEGGNKNPGATEPLGIGWEIQLSGTPGEGFFGIASGSISGSEAESSTAISDGIEAEPTFLSHGTTYYYRLIAYYAGKQVVSPEESVTTLAVTAPVVEADPASLITGTGAKFTGKVNPGNADPAFNSECLFDYVPAARSEHQRLKVEASGGYYMLSFEGAETSDIPFDATAAEIQSALEALPAIGSGNVSVSGGVGIHPYLIVFGGALADKDLPQVGTVTQKEIAILNFIPTLDPGGTAVATTGLQGSDGSFANAKSPYCTEPDTIVEGAAPEPVELDVTGLEPHTIYHLRLRAQNQGGVNTDEAPDFTTEALEPQTVDLAVLDIGTEAATLEAEINPRGSATTYHFEYLTQAQYEADANSFANATKTAESGEIGSDNESHPAQAEAPGLAPDTAYRYRVVATNAESAGEGTPSFSRGFHTKGNGPEEEGPDNCPNAAVRGQQGSQYLPECRAYEIVNRSSLDLGDVTRAPVIADDGEHANYVSLLAPDDALGAAMNSSWLAERTATGWKSIDANMSSIRDIGNTMSTLPQALSEDFSRELVYSAVQGDPNDADPSYDSYRIDVGTGVSDWLSPGADLPDAQLGTVKNFGASKDLGRTFFNGQEDVFVPGGPTHGVYSSDGHTVRMESILPDGSMSQSGLPAAFGFERSYEDSRTDGSFIAHGGRHGVSDDGSRAFFTDSGNLYVRVDGTSTIAVGKSQRTGDVDTLYPARFVAANHAGTVVYFLSSARLTDAATVGGGIYRFDTETNGLTLLTPDAGEPSGLALGSAIASDDNARLYFTSPADLATGAQAGQNNAYVWSQADGVRWITATGDAGTKVARVSRDGGYALIESSASIDGAPSNGRRAIYEYGYVADELACVSCRPDGSPSAGDANLDAQSIGFPPPTFATPRNITDDGKVIFATTDRLVSADQSPAADVYLYDKGALSLISSGRGDQPAYVADNSDDGRDIFFITRSALVGADRDPGELDLYDARSQGGFLEPPPPAAPCEGEACRTATSSVPAGVAPTTSSLIGPGNPKPCAKGKTRRHGRCVKPRKHRHKKHASKKHKSQKRDANANGRAGR